MGHSAAAAGGPEVGYARACAYLASTSLHARQVARLGGLELVYVCP
jgi:hypothetical protein